MTDEQLGNYIHAEISEIIEEREDEIVRQFLACDPGLTPQAAALLTKAVSLSSQISIQYTLRFLENSGLLSLPGSGQPLLSLRPSGPPQKE